MNIRNYKIRIKALFNTKLMTADEISKSPVTYIMFLNRWKSAPIHSKINYMTLYHQPLNQKFWVYPLDIKADILELWNDFQIYIDSPNEDSGDWLKTINKMQKYADILKAIGKSK